MRHERQRPPAGDRAGEVQKAGQPNFILDLDRRLATLERRQRLAFEYLGVDVGVLEEMSTAAFRSGVIVTWEAEQIVNELDELTRQLDTGSPLKRPKTARERTLQAIAERSHILSSVFVCSRL